MENYTEALINPFLGGKTPKLLDGKSILSSSIRLRKVGEIVCDPVNVTGLWLAPGFSNSLLWRTSATTTYNPGPFQSHFGTAADRSMIKNLRLVGCGLKLSMVNNADQNEGYWEAARIPFDTLTYPHIDTSNGTLAFAAFISSTNVNDIDLSMMQTYQTGKLRDLHRFMFKLNSQTAEHPFQNIQTRSFGITGAVGVSGSSEENCKGVVDESFDMIIIKIHGRNDASNPTTLHYDTVSIQEVEYMENSALGRLATPSGFDPRFATAMTLSKSFHPAIQIS